MQKFVVQSEKFPVFAIGLRGKRIRKMNLCLAVKLELSSARIVIFKSVGWKEKIEKEIKFRNFQKRKEIQRNFTLKQNVKQLEQKLNRTATDGRLSKQSTFENFKE